MTKFEFSYVTHKGQVYMNSSSIYAEGLYFAVKKFKNNHNEDCKIIGVRGTVETEMGTFQIIGLTI